MSSNSAHEDAGRQISSKLDYRKRNTRWYEKEEELGQGEKTSHISAEWVKENSSVLEFFCL